MRNRLLAACLSLSLAACGGTEDSGSAPDESARPTGSIADVQSALSALPAAQVLGAHDDGVPFMIRGELGSASGPVKGLAAREAHERVGPALDAIAPVFRLRAADLVVQRLSRDAQGHTHIRYAQTRNGLPVFGHELIVHVDESGRVYAANGSARDGESVAAPGRAKVSSEAVQRAALESTPGAVRVEGEPRLLYARSTVDQRLKLAFEVVVTGESQGSPVREHVFLDALDGSVVQRFSDIHHVRDRYVYSANNTTTLPGTLKRTETSGPSGDPVVDTAFLNLGVTYDCYKALFNRDSYNNLGAPLRATVHYGVNYNNAYWNGSQMVCGDGDGTLFSPLCNDMDVITHELTHGVTTSESNLVYSGESGGLNESLSDVFSAVCESWDSGWTTSSNIWKIGEDVYTPATPGDAIRHLDDPALDGARDYYTLPLPSSAYEIAGISNLAFALLSKGGLHPRGKSTINVIGIGVEKAGRSFYKANTDFFTATTTIPQAKVYTEQAAEILYGAAVKSSVTQAWQAVGVGVPPPPPPLCAPLANGVALSGLSGGSGAMSCAYPIAIPVGATNLKVEISGGTGDADLYVKSGGIPTTASFDCRPYLGGNTETCTFATPATGVYYIVLRGFAAYSGVTLKASFTAPAGAYVFPNLAGASGSTQQLWAYRAAAGQAVTITLSPNMAGSTGDADLYVKFGTAASTSSYDCRPYLGGNTERCTLSNPTAGTYYILLRGFSAYTGVDLSVSVP